MTYAHEFPGLPAIPKQIHTRGGQVVATQPTIWCARSYPQRGRLVKINWELLARMTEGEQPAFTPRAAYLIKLYITHRLQTQSPTTAEGDEGQMRHFGRWFIADSSVANGQKEETGFDWSRLDEKLAREYLDWCVIHRATPNKPLGCLRSFYEWGVARQIPDFTLPTLKVLQAIRVPAHARGHHVRFRHVTRGPFSPNEIWLIRRALIQEQGCAQDRILIMLHLELGANPSAFTRLINQDLHAIETSRGLWYQLDVPRIKKGRSRRETKRRPISQRLGLLLTELKQGDANERLLYWLSADRPEECLRYNLNRWVKAVNLISPRTGELLEIRPRRFRYTYATHLAAEGISKYHLAELLDHSNLNSVHIYVETTPSITEKAAQATDAALKPIIDRFLGKIIDTSEDLSEIDREQAALIPAGAPHIGLPILNTGGVGVCGRNVRQDGLCRLFPPLSCYLCPSFSAWHAGPHADMLGGIEQFIAANQKAVDGRILQQLDEVRLAIAAVVAQYQKVDEAD